MSERFNEQEDDEDERIRAEMAERENRELRDIADEGDDEPEGDEPAGGRADDDGDDGDEPERSGKPRYGSPDDDIADEIAARLLEEQSAKSREFDDDLSDPKNTVGRVVEGDEGEEPPAEGEPERHAAAEDDDDPPVEITVRGQKMTVKMSALIAKAQQVEAGDSYLAESRRILDEAKALQAQIARGEITPEQHAAAEKGLSAEQKEERKRLHEVIAYGSQEEIETAFNSFEQEVVEKAQRQIEKSFETRARDWAISEDIAAADEHLRENHKDFVEPGPRRERFLGNVIYAQKEMMARHVENLDAATRAAFERANLGPSHLRQMQDPQQVVATYVRMQQKGYTLPPLSVVSRDMAEYTARNLDPGATAGTARGTADETGGGRVRVSAERSQRKEGLTPTPQRAGVGQGRTSAPRRTSEQDFHKAAMEEYREQSQGFTLPRRR